MSPLRRPLLQSIGAVGAATVLAGCSGNSDATATAKNGPEETSTESTATGTRETTGDGGALESEGGPNVVEGVPERADHVVDVESIAFAPEELTVEPGDTVAFEHVEGTAYVYTFETAGTHEYYCIPHSHVQMEGTVVVD